MDYQIICPYCSTRIKRATQESEKNIICPRCRTAISIDIRNKEIEIHLSDSTDEQPQKAK